MQPEINNSNVSTLKVGSSAEFEREITEEDVLSFARNSGDWSPIHVDKAYAHTRNPRGRIVHGGFQVALASALLGMHLPGGNVLLGSINSRFMTPLYFPCRVRVRGEITSWNPDNSWGRLKVTVQEATAVVPSAEISMGFTFHQATHEATPMTSEATVPTRTSTLRQDQKVILVTGASGGIGREIVSGLARDCSVLAMVNQTPLNAELKNLPNVTEVRADLSAPGWPEEIHSAFPDSCLYGIVHAAWPGAPSGGLLHARDDVIEQQLAFGTLHTIRLARLLFDCAPAEGGRFVALGSAYGSHQPAISLAAYSLGKAALENTVTLLAPELARKQITINTVCPSFVPAGMNQSVSETRRRKEESQVPMGRLCLPEDVVGIVQFLLSSSASFVSGQDIQLSGAQL